MKAILKLLILVLSFNAYAQTEPEVAIKQLKEGALIVKLIVQEKKVEQLLKANKKELALQVQEEEKKQNEAIIQSFSSTYTFSPLYFIYSNDMGKLADGDASVLFDINGQPARKIPDSYIFVEFSESPVRGIDGLLVRDAKSYILNKPFPYFLSEWDFFHINKIPYPTLIAKWQKNTQKL